MYATHINCQLTRWGDPDKTHMAGAGPIYYGTWLKLELKRIMATPGRMAEIRTEDGEVSLWVNGFRWKSMCQCDDCVDFIPINRQEDAW